MTNNQRPLKSYPKPTIKLLLILLIAVGAVQTSSLLADEKKQDHNYDSLIRKVQESLKKKRFLEAMNFADQAIEKNPTQYEAFSLLAIAATQLGQKDIAATAISQAVELANREQRLKLFPIWRKIDLDGATQAAQVRADKGTSAYADGLAFQAAQQFEEAWRIKPEKAAWGLQSARAYLEIKSYLPGISLLREIALSLDDKVAAEADQQLQQISGLIETLYQERMDNATKQFKADDLVAAEKNWMEAIEIAPFRPDAYYELSQLYLEQGDQKRAVKALRQAVQYGDRNPKRVLKKEIFYDLWGNADYLNLVESMYGSNEKKRIANEYKIEMQLEDPDYELGLKLYLGKGIMMDRGRAYMLFRKAAERGHTLAKTFVAFQYAKGEYGVQKDSREAMQWFEKSIPAIYKLAEKGDPVAQNNLGDMYYEGHGVPKDVSEAVRWYRASADQNYPPAQNNLGYLYGSGDGVEESVSEALKWYHKAADQNYAIAQNTLGYSYGNGWGVEENDVKAVEWYRKAAEQNYSVAQVNLGESYYDGEGFDKSYAEALKWYRKAADQKYAVGETLLGYMYHYGKGVEQDYYQAEKWYRKAAEQGYAIGQFNLGALYNNAQGVTKDEYEAVKWFREAAEQGYLKAQYQLGRAYSKAEGVEKNDINAVKWYRKAAEQGYLEAQYQLGRAYSKAAGVEKNDINAVKWYRKAAEQGKSEAQFRLGWAYHYGEGVERNDFEAVKWYRKAADQNHTAGLNNLGYMYSNGRGVQKSTKEAIKWYRRAAQQGNSAAKNNLRKLGYTP